jgi:hypothetical protein
MRPKNEFSFLLRNKLWIQSLIRIPKNFVLGFGLVNPSRSSVNTFLSRIVAVPFTSIVAPVYNFSPGGKCLVLLQAANKELIKHRMI